MRMIAALSVPLEAMGMEFVDFVLQSVYLRWAVILFVVLVGASIISGLLDVGLMIAQYGLVVLIALGILEFVAPGLLSTILNAIPI